MDERFFRRKEAQILDLITNNLEMFKLSPKQPNMRQSYGLCATEEARELLGTILRDIYRAGKEGT